MKKKYFFIFILAYIFKTINIFSQTVEDSTVVSADTLWKTGSQSGLNFSNVGLSNWAGGGTELISVTGLTFLFADYKSEIMSWENSLDVGYGVVKQGTEELRKSDDRLIIVSKYGYNATPQLYYTALVDFRTQFDLGYDYSKKEADSVNPLLISAFMSPAYLNMGLGLNYKPVDYWQIYLSVISNRLIIVLNDKLSAQGAYGVNPGEKIFSQLGITANVTFQKDILENVNLKSRLNLFSAYNRLNSIVVNSETALIMKVNSYINASFMFDVIYDDKVTINRSDGTTGPATQIRHVIGIGLTYKLGSEKK